MIRIQLLKPLSALCALAATQMELHAIEVEGTALPIQSVIISSPAQGIIAATPVEEGDSVKTGDTLIQLRDDQETLELERYDQMIEQAEREYSAAKRLAASGSGTSSERDERETELKRLQSERALVQLRKDEKRVTSPLDGILVVKVLEVGESVDQVEDMFEVVNIDTIVIRMYLKAEALKFLKKGLELPLTFPAFSNEQVFRAKVDFIDSRIDSASGLLRVKLIMDNPGHEIKAGMRAKVQVPDGE